MLLLLLLLMLMLMLLFAFAVLPLAFAEELIDELGAGGIMDMRFIRRASVGLTVRAPRPVACDAWRTGAMDMRFEAVEWPNVADLVLRLLLLFVEALPLKLPVLLLWLTVLGGRWKPDPDGAADMDVRDDCWNERVLEAREPLRFLAASLPLLPSRLPPSMDDRAEPAVGRSELEAKLGRRRDVDLPRPALYSESSTPGPMDFRGGLPMLLLDTGG